MNLIIPAQNLKNIDSSLNLLQNVLTEYSQNYSRAIVVSRFQLPYKIDNGKIINLVYRNNTAGAMCTALLTIDNLVKSEPVLIAGSN
jgi:hypothetical protein